MEIETDQNQIDEIKRKATGFLSVYIFTLISLQDAENSDLIDKMTEEKQKRLIINTDKVRQYDSELGREYYY